MNQSRSHLFALAAISLLILGTGCSDRNPTDLPVSSANNDPLVFDDDYSEDVYFQPFFRTHYTGVEMDSVYSYNGFAPDGNRSLKFNIPPTGSSLGLFTGGVITSVGKRDLSGYNALTFYARANNPLELAATGFGNDNTGTSRYEVGRLGIHLTRDWTFVIIPIPAPSKLIAERGLFTFAQAPDENFPDGYDIWIDEIRYAKLGNISDPDPDLGYWRQKYFVGSKVTLGGAFTDFMVDGATISVGHSPYYFDYLSSDPSVAVVTGIEINLLAPGNARITAELEGVPATGYIDVTVYAPPPTAATPPGLPAGDVVSMFSNAYDDVLVDTWRTNWSNGGYLQDYVVAEDDTKMYSDLFYVGIEFLNPTIDASDMTHLHLDVYAPAGSDLKIKLVSFPADPGIEKIQTYDLLLGPTSVPPFDAGAWMPLDIPLADFQINPDIPGYTWDDWDWSNIGQLVISTATAGPTRAETVLVDNVYWHK
ncbi:MAG: hypothetical protein ABFS42_13565 [Candidatus Krumholzibacteriota bacterium]